MNRILDQSENLLILGTNYIGSLGYIHQNMPYVIPITYFYNQEQHNLICYSAMGHKINAMRKNEAVSLSVIDVDAIDEWKSVLVHGSYNEHTGSDAKALLPQFSLGVKDLISRKEKRNLSFIKDFSSKIEKDEIPIVFTIQIEDITGRMR